MVRARVRADTKEICARIRAVSWLGDQDAQNRFVFHIVQTTGEKQPISFRHSVRAQPMQQAAIRAQENAFATPATEVQY